MSIFGKARAGGFMDEIRCDESSYLIWKWHPAGAKSGSNNRENAIRWGSSLRVRDGEVAVFVYHNEKDIMQDFIEGPYDEKLKTKNLPILASIIGLAYEGGTPFQAEVYFINLAQIIQVRFAVPFFDVYDPRFEDFGVPVAVRGSISFKIADYREFIKLHRLTSFELSDFQNQIKDAVSRYVKDVVANAPAENNIPLVRIESKTALINDEVEYHIKERLRENFGVLVSGVDLNSIEIDKSSDGYTQLMNITRDVTSAVIKSETSAKVRDIADKQRIEAENYGETLRIQREEGQYAMHKQTQSSNIGAFQIEKQAEVGIAGANALGKMGANGAGNMDLSGNGSGTGFNMAALMTSMALGGTVGKNIAASMNSMMSGLGEQPPATTAPPPVPMSVYHIAVDGNAVGPYDIAGLRQMALDGHITGGTLAWKQGMDEWKKISDIEELKGIMPGGMPPVPPGKGT